MGFLWFLAGVVLSSVFFVQFFSDAQRRYRDVFDMQRENDIYLPVVVAAMELADMLENSPDVPADNEMDELCSSVATMRERTN